jgi:hypothetical protein
LFGTLGYFAGGDKGSFVGAAVDGVALSLSGIEEPVFQTEPDLKLVQEKVENTRNYNPNKPALIEANINIPASQNKGAPDFEGTPFLYQPKPEQRSIVKIKLTGSYSADFAQANSAANLENVPTGYTWHHLDDYNQNDGTATMQLVRTNIHIKTAPHSGGVKQYENATGAKYKP